MSEPLGPIFVGEAVQQPASRPARGGFVTLWGEAFYRIQNFDALEPFFLSLVSSTDHWLFIASTGGLAAGRVSAEQAVFPYYTDDKLTENSANTGHLALLRVRQGGRTYLWEPLAERGRGAYRVERSLYKNIAGTAIIFEEHNLDLALTYRCAWRAGERFGLVLSTWLTNAGAETRPLTVLGGLQNLLPANVGQATQSQFSNLLDAYKRSELVTEAGLALFTLSSTLTDRAEPSESLLATTVLPIGLGEADVLLSSRQVDQFRRGLGVTPEREVRGRRGAYLAQVQLDLAPGAERVWHLAVDTGQDSAAVLRLVQALRLPPDELARQLADDLAANHAQVVRYVAAADGCQISNQPLTTAHHFANTLFNVMRGGVFAAGYQITAADFRAFAALRDRPALQAHAAFFAALPEQFPAAELIARAEAAQVPALERLSRAYLPLTFSRRHGDPSRPWNRFVIDLKNPDGSRRLGYEGNWRDIFQNWEALAYAYPEFTEGMLSTFLNATTVDGYNPYRITQAGGDWETPEPGNPWANFGYWSDHQIIYLQKLMEASARFHPGWLDGALDQPLFTCTEIPYRIKPYTDLLRDPSATIDFNWELERQITARVRAQGADGKLVRRPDGASLQVSLAEKLLTLLLAKLANFVPEGGLWMNTQRPEWNDANNALVGKGVSVVTLAYLRRFIVFFRELLGGPAASPLTLSREVHAFYEDAAQALRRFEPVLAGAFRPEQRRALLDALGEAGSRYRWNFYEHGLSGAQSALARADLDQFLALALRHVEHALRANQRGDGLYHAYNILHLEAGGITLGRLAEMLEGQVAILSSGLLSDEEALTLLTALRHSRLYRGDQHSYLLYPDRALPGFLEKNRLTPDQVRGLRLAAALDEAQDRSLLVRDDAGDYHFNGRFRNRHDVEHTLQALGQQPQFAELVAAETEAVLNLFEATFRHAEFTGRSGTFFAYEGLGSIYWHMVSKLLLAAQEAAVRAALGPAGPALRERYFDVRAGLGFNKPPDVYGAFPTDPYSHTPAGQGAKQPGMTGMVKEELLTRQAELGWSVDAGRLVFNPWLVDPAELLTAPAIFEYLSLAGDRQTLLVEAGALAYTICQTPVILRRGPAARLSVVGADGQTRQLAGAVLDADTSRQIFQRGGQVQRLEVELPIAP